MTALLNEAVRPLCDQETDQGTTTAAIVPPATDKKRRVPRGTPVADRLERRTDRNGPTPERRPELGRCWTWDGARSTAGYGQLRVAGRLEYAHIVSYTLAHGAPPAGYEIDHRCRTRACVRPDHLEAVTHRENGLRGDSPPAVNARKTECDHGHPFDAANTYLRKDRPGARQCRTCSRNRKKARI